MRRHGTGIRYGRLSSHMVASLDRTGGLRQRRALNGKVGRSRKPSATELDGARVSGRVCSALPRAPTIGGRSRSAQRRATMAKVLVLYHSTYGRIERVAAAVAEGARCVERTEVSIKCACPN